MRRLIVLLLPALLLAGCREPDRPTTPVTGAGLFVDSDPQGGRILVNGAATGLTTPDTVRELTVDRHLLEVHLDSGGYTYRASGTISTNADVVTEVTVPLLLPCPGPPCLPDYYAPAGVRFAVAPTGPLMFLEGSGGGALWPAGTGNSYVSTAMPVLAGVSASAPDTVALGTYDYFYMSGRPAPIRDEGTLFRLTQSAWITPPAEVQGVRTIRGIEVTEEILSSPSAPDAVVIRLTYTNVTDRISYQTIDPAATGGLTYESVWLGMALDGDVGGSEDDLISYFPALDMAVLYDGDFRETGFSAEWRDRPGLVGLRLLEKPAGTTVALNAWPRAQDWQAEGLRRIFPSPGQREASGLGWLSATQTVLPNHPDPRLGYAPSERNDYRVSAAAGPVTLRPGQSASITVAVVFAAPEAGSFTSGVLVPAGDPTDTSRQLYSVGAGLRASAQAAEAVAGGS